MSENPYFRLPLFFEPEKYYGPGRVVLQLLEAISGWAPVAVELNGPTGMGKSTTLKYLADPRGAFRVHRDWLQNTYSQEPERLLAILVECKGIPPETDPFAGIYKSVQAACQDYMNRNPDRNLDNLIHLPSIVPDGQFGDLLCQIFQGLSEANVRTVLLLDDFEIIFERFTSAQSISMRAWMAFISCVISTEKALHDANPALTTRSSPFTTMLMLRMEPLTQSEARRLLVEPAQDIRAPFSDEDVEYLLPLVGNHPYLLFIAGRILWDMLHASPESGGAPLSTIQRGILRARLYEEYRRRFAYYVEKLTPKERAVLDRVVHQGTTALAEDDFVAVEALLRRGLLQQSSQNEYEPFSVLFKEYLLERSGGPVLEDQESTAMELGKVESRLYTYLEKNMERACSFDEIYQNVWDDPNVSTAVMHRRVQVAVSRLRNKLRSIHRPYQEDILNFREQGYKLSRSSS